MPSTSTTADPRRVACQCRISGCYKGLYVDAYGISQRGVKVLPATKEAHDHAELRSRIQSASNLPPRDSSRSAGSPGIHLDHPIDPLTDLGLGSLNLTEFTAREAPTQTSAPLVLNSNKSQSHTHVPADTFPMSSSKNDEDTNRPLIMISKSTTTSTGTILRNNTYILDPNVSAAALISREKGLLEFDCSKFLK